MSSSRTTTTENPTIGAILTQYFKVTDLERHSEHLLESWVSVLSNLDHLDGQFLCLSDVQFLSNFLLSFKSMATDQHATAKEAVV